MVTTDILSEHSTHGDLKHSQNEEYSWWAQTQSAQTVLMVSTNTVSTNSTHDEHKQSAEHRHNTHIILMVSKNKTFMLSKHRSGQTVCDVVITEVNFIHLFICLYFSVVQLNGQLFWWYGDSELWTGDS